MQLQKNKTPTDSVIALIPRDCNPFEAMLGNSLGQLTDETEGYEIIQGVFGGGYLIPCK